MEQKFIVMSADALVTEDLEILKTLPNYKKYVAGGAATESMLSVYPTVTYAAHTAMATGCFPGKTGIISNFENNAVRVFASVGAYARPREGRGHLYGGKTRGAYYRKRFLACHGQSSVR